jgi:hypothetical protein
MPRRAIAREWLIFLAMLAVGLTVAPIAVLAWLSQDLSRYRLFFPALVDSNDWPKTWAVALGPYILAQLTRSVIWAAKTVRNSN